MLTAVKQPQTLTTLQLAPAAQLPAVIDETAVKRSVQRAYQAGLDLDRRFDLVFTGMGKHVDNLPSVRFARRIRVGDGTPGGYVTHMMKRAVLLASPAGIGMLVLFGAAGASDLALMVAAAAPFGWVGAAAVRSMRADRVADRDIASASINKATVEDVEKIETFVKAINADGNLVTAAMTRQLITEWVAKGETEEFLTSSAVARLLVLRDSIAEPTADDKSAAERLLNAGREITALEARGISKRTLAKAEEVIAGVNGLERDALAARWRHALVGEIINGGTKVQRALLKVLPNAEASNTNVSPPITIEYARARQASS
jgi:hypothetical protein